MLERHHPPMPNCHLSALRGAILWMMMMTVCMTTLVTSFCPSTPLSVATTRTSALSNNHLWRGSRTWTTRRFLSDVPREKETENENKSKMSASRWWKDRLPPPPEDQLVMSGDIAALFVYAFLDHSLNQMYTDSVLYDTTATTRQVLDPFGDLSTHQVPVWFDAATSLHMTSGKLMSLLGLEHLSYSPILGTAGTSSVVLCLCWLLAGYVHQAFLFRNTLDCSTENALWVTFRTWITSTLLVMSVALASDYICGHTHWFVACECPLSLVRPALGGLTKADVNFILDSFTVLVTWRFVLSVMLGYHRK